jgi:predicted metal-dependent peptidase
MTKDEKRKKLINTCLKYNTEQLLNNLYNMGYDWGIESLEGEIEELKKEIEVLKKNKNTLMNIIGEYGDKNND